MVDDFVFSAGDPKWVVTAVQPQKDYTLFLTFGDGERRIYNALPLLGKSIYEPLRNMAFFLSARVGGDTVCWGDDVDIAPEHLYECSIPVT